MLKLYLTHIDAIDPTTGDLCKWVGPKIAARSEQEARHYLDDNGFGYCSITGEYICTTLDGVTEVGLYQGNLS